MRRQGAHYLLELGVVSNILSTKLARKLYLAIFSTKMTLIVSDETDATCHKAATNIPVSFSELKENMELLVVDGVSTEVLIDILETEKLNAYIDLGG